jgi:hypothetical protein
VEQRNKERALRKELYKSIFDLKKKRKYGAIGIQKEKTQSKAPPEGGAALLPRGRPLVPPEGGKNSRPPGRIEELQYGCANTNETNRMHDMR